MKHQTLQRAIEVAISDVLDADGGLMRMIVCEACDEETYQEIGRVSRDQIERIAEAIVPAIERWQRQHPTQEASNVRGNIRVAENAELHAAAVHSATVGR